MNPESPTNVIEIRKQVDSFLDGFGYSQYAPFVGIEQGLFSDLNIPSFMQNQLAATTTPDPYLTGANTASLPMTFSLIHSTGISRIQFTLLINPANMNHGKTSSVQASYSRNGFVTQIWGPNQDLITATGSTAGFMIEGIGLTAVGRRRAFAFLNFISLMATYRNNGYIYNDPTLLQGLTRVIDRMTGVEMTYDGQLYMGHFNNFTLDENADRPFAINFNLEFVASTLSNNYHEVRGHFASIDDVISYNTNTPTQLIDNVTKQNAPSQVAQEAVKVNVTQTTYTGGDPITATNASIPSTGFSIPDMVLQNNLNNPLYGRISLSNQETDTISTLVPVTAEGTIGFGRKLGYGGAVRDIGSVMATGDNVYTLMGNVGFGGGIQKNTGSGPVLTFPKNPG